MLKMPELIICKSSKDLRPHLSNIVIDENYNNNKSDNINLKDENPFMDFISSKKKLILKSCFDHKGTKKFLSDKRKAMEEMILSDEIISDNQEKTKKLKKSSLRHKSEDYIINLRNEKKENKNNKVKKYSDKTIIPKYVKEKRNSKKAKKDIKSKSRFSIIASNFSDIQGNNEPDTLIIHNNDSFIHKIIKEM